MKRVLRYFIQGLILFIPLIITITVIFNLFNFLASNFSFVRLSNNTFINTFLCLLAILIFIALLGTLASSFIFKRIFSYFEDKLEHAPFIRHIYSPVKDFTNAFVGNKKRFNKPVLVLTNAEAHIHEIGFLTQEDLKDLNIHDKVAVYLPMSYSLSGRLIIVPKENIRPLEADAGNAMKFVVSGGVTDVD